MQHPMRITRTQLADGRELLYFDDAPDLVPGRRPRALGAAREAPGARSRAPDEPHFFAAGE